MEWHEVLPQRARVVLVFDFEFLFFMIIQY